MTPDRVIDMHWPPWRSRSERKAAVAEALGKAQQSRRSAAKAEKLAADLRAIERDELARAILEGLGGGT
jgi:hypothetical protein